MKIVQTIYVDPLVSWIAHPVIGEQGFGLCMLEIDPRHGKGDISSHVLAQCGREVSPPASFVTTNFRYVHCDSCDWEALLSYIEAMCAAGGYEFADRTLNGIYDRVKLAKHCTEKQNTAVNNIKKSKRPRMRQR